MLPSCIMQLQEQTLGPKQVNRACFLSSQYCCWDLTGDLFCFLREHKGRSKGSSLLWEISPFSCSFWVQGSSCQSSQRARGIGAPKLFHLSCPPQENLIYHSPAPSRTVIFRHTMNFVGFVFFNDLIFLGKSSR